MVEHLKLFELYEVDGGGMGYHIKTYGWFDTHANAKKAAKLLGHPYYDIRMNVPALRVDDKIYILCNSEPVNLGLQVLVNKQKSEALPLP